MDNIKSFTFFVALVAMTSITGCVKEQSAASEIGLLPANCGNAGARVQASINEAAYCANGQITAIGGAGSAMVTGLDVLGNTLVLQFDTLATGAHAITEAQNGLLYMQAGQAYVVPPGEGGTLTITHHDQEARSLKATFQVTLFNEVSGQNRQVQGDLDVVYQVQE